LTKKDLRIITGWIFLFIIFALIYLGGWWFCAFLLALIVFGMKELLQMFHHKDLQPSIVTAYLGCFLFMFLGGLGEIKYLHLASIFLFVCSFLAILRRGKNARIRDIGATLIAIVYGGLLPSHFMFMRTMNAGTVDICGKDVSLALCFVVFVLVGVTATDAGAYFVGSKFGKHKLWEAISPNKTIEGSIGGALITLALCLLLGYDFSMGLWQSLGAAILVTVFAQLGDLVESMLKRDAGAKDASDILPGHGGFLDRADSYIFTAPILYYYFYYVVVNPVF